MVRWAPLTLPMLESLEHVAAITVAHLCLLTARADELGCSQKQALGAVYACVCIYSMITVTVTLIAQVGGDGDADLRQELIGGLQERASPPVVALPS